MQVNCAIQVKLKPVFYKAIQWNIFGDHPLVKESFPTIWFMRSNHSFKEVTNGSREEIFKQVRTLFDSDKYGSIFARCIKNTELNELRLHGNKIKSTDIRVHDEDIEAWLDILENIEKIYFVEIGKNIVQIVSGDWVMEDCNGNISVVKNEEYLDRFEVV